MFATDWRIPAQEMNRQENYTLDPAGNLTRQIIATPGRTAWSWQGQLNASNQLTQTQQGFASATASGSGSRSLTITDPLGHVSRTEYNSSVSLPGDKPPSPCKIRVGVKLY
jgi:hypothetical protein